MPDLVPLPGSERAGLPSAVATGAALGSTVTASAGDSGSSDDPQHHPGGPVQVDFPASSPYALACGGSTLGATRPLARSSRRSSGTSWRIRRGPAGAA